jgi:DNA-directed RNA polymerase sigma subunit (sigma70/sigma32)
VGRGNRAGATPHGQPRPSARKNALTPEQRERLNARYFIRRLWGRAAAGVTGTADTQEKLLSQQARGLGLLSPADQRKLITTIRLLRQSDDPMDRQLARQGQDIMLLAHHRFVEQFVRENQGRSLDNDTLRQVARMGILKMIDDFDDDKGASPLHYAASKMRGELRKAEEYEADVIRIKSKAKDLKGRIEKIVKDFDNRGVQPTIQQIVDILNNEEAEKAKREGRKPTELTVERVAEIFAHVGNAPVSLDRPLDLDDGSVNVGAIIADEAAVTERDALNEAQAKAVRDAIAKIESPLERRIVERYFGIGSDEEVPQKALYDGVYRDKDGKAYSAEPSVIADRRPDSDRARQNPGIVEPVEKRSETELRQMWERGEMTFEPGTPEAKELYELTGTPPSSGTVQYALKKAFQTMGAELGWMRDEVRYRGDNELEHSETAREEVRRALVEMGVIESMAKARKMKTTRPAEDGTLRKKSELRKLAEKHGLVDERGRVRLHRIQAPVGPVAPPPRPKQKKKKAGQEMTFDDFAELMSDV